jgi:MFS transporter, ACS family, D-galactonate transporter
VLWNLWFFSFWSVSIVADAAHTSFGRSALIAAFNAGAGAVVLFLFVRESAKSQVLGRREARDGDSRLGPRIEPSQRTAV